MIFVSTSLNSNFSKNKGLVAPNDVANDLNKTAWLSRYDLNISNGFGAN